METTVNGWKTTERQVPSKRRRLILRYLYEHETEVWIKKALLVHRESQKVVHRTIGPIGAVGYVIRRVRGGESWGYPRPSNLLFTSSPKGLESFEMPIFWVLTLTPTAYGHLFVDQEAARASCAVFYAEHLVGDTTTCLRLVVGLVCVETIIL